MAQWVVHCPEKWKVWGSNLTMIFILFKQLNNTRGILFASYAEDSRRRSLQFCKRFDVNGRHKLTLKKSHIYENFKSIWRAHFWLDLDEFVFNL